MEFFYQPDDDREGFHGEEKALFDAAAAAIYKM